MSGVDGNTSLEFEVKLRAMGEKVLRECGSIRSLIAAVYSPPAYLNFF